VKVHREHIVLINCRLERRKSKYGRKEGVKKERKKGKEGGREGMKREGGKEKEREEEKEWMLVRNKLFFLSTPHTSEGAVVFCFCITWIWSGPIANLRTKPSSCKFASPRIYPCSICFPVRGQRLENRC
jgi:hypothetical protein